MKENATDAVPEEREVLETTPEDPDPNEEIIELVDLVDEEPPFTDVTSDETEPDSGESLEAETGPYPDVLDDTDEEFDDGPVEAASASHTGDSDTEVDKDEVELNLETALAELFDSGELTASRLLEEAMVPEEEIVEPPAIGDDFQEEEFTDLEVAAETAGEEVGVVESPADIVGDELAENSFDDIELEEEGVSTEAKTEEKLEEGDVLPEDAFDDLVAVEELADEVATSAEAVGLEADPPLEPDEIEWIGREEYYPRVLQNLDRQIAQYKRELEEKINKLVAEKEELKKNYEALRSILYLKDEELKKAVADIFTEYWSLNITHMDRNKRAEFKENILIEHDGRSILAKIKGTYSGKPPYKFITQLWQDLHYSGLGASAEGALIVNYDIEKDPKERGLAYPGEDEEQLEDIILIDTRALYNLTLAIIDHDFSLAESKKILFKKGRVECDLDDLKD